MHIRSRLSIGTALTIAAAAALAVPATVFAQSFPDVPASHSAYAAVEYLKEQGFVEGYSDGTFKPGQTVNRAEAMKFIIAPLVEAGSLDQYTSSVFGDVPAEAWFLKYVEHGRSQSIIDGPPKKTNFLPADTIIKVEFLKMVLLAHGLDPHTAYSEIRLPLSNDVSNPEEWYYPYMRYAITASMTMISQNGTLDPGIKLTRGDTAILLHRLLMYKEGRRAQALLSETESEILVVLGSLEQNDIVAAEYASARALLAARGAHFSKPDVPTVQAALKITEAFRALVRAYRAGVEGQLDEVVRLTGDAWNLAAKAKEINADIASLSEQVQLIAKNMADEARALMAQ